MNKELLEENLKYYMVSKNPKGFIELIYAHYIPKKDIEEEIEKMKVSKHDNVIPEPTEAELDKWGHNDDYFWCGRDINAYEAKMYNKALETLKANLLK